MYKGEMKVPGNIYTDTRSSQIRCYTYYQRVDTLSLTKYIQGSYHQLRAS